jgi:mannose-6-phosphate isomerase-like protein (cupin superfamily)
VPRRSLLTSGLPAAIMPDMTTTMQKRNMGTPDETRMFSKGKVQLVTLEGVTFGLATFEPGWKWSTSVKPIAQTASCEAPHTAYHLSGTLHVVMDDGTETEFGPGDIAIIPPGHDAWVVGNEPVVCLDITGMVNYAKKA